MQDLAFEDVYGNKISKSKVFKKIYFNGKQVSKIDTSKIGKYELETFAISEEGVRSQVVIREIYVVDDSKPNIEINGEETVTLKKGQKYLDEGCQIRDNVDGEFTILATDFDMQY